MMRHQAREHLPHPGCRGLAINITAGGSHTCALLNTGDVRCWGLASNGQLGYGNTNNIGDNEAHTFELIVKVF